MGEKLAAFIALLREVQKIDPEFPIHYAVCLAEIARDEGLSLTALAERAALPLSTVSRIVGALSHRRQKGNAYDLVRVTVCAAERRRKELSLTPRGQRMIADIAAHIR